MAALSEFSRLGERVQGGGSIGRRGGYPDWQDDADFSPEDGSVVQ